MCTFIRSSHSEKERKKKKENRNQQRNQWAAIVPKPRLKSVWIQNWEHEFSFYHYLRLYDDCNTDTGCTSCGWIHIFFKFTHNYQHIIIDTYYEYSIQVASNNDKIME